MDALTAFVGFLGGWLLVAGPIYQAALELKDEDMRKKRIDAIRAKMPTATHSSPWWWLFPPVKLVLEHRNNERYRQEFFVSLPQEDAEAMVSFINKATGWLLVASGAFLIALKETYEVIEHFELSIWWFWLLAIVLAFLSFAYTAVRMSRSEKMLSERRK